ncbi:frequency clock protein [Xylariaceae sp. FL0594]|nr:frequency clock protein [Xylariaceae sp. FL0594]
MSNPENVDTGIDSASLPTITYKNPRRTSPENSTTLRNHRIARDASRLNLARAMQDAQAAGTPEDQQEPVGRESSGEWSDGKQWFKSSNEHAGHNLDTNSMDIDPPFFQRETNSSNEAIRHILPRYAQEHRFGNPSRVAQSSSADDFRSVIDDLTIENRRLKEELRRLKQMGPDSLRRDKLFEVKVHGLPSKKRRELEAALRDFTTSVEGSSTGASTRRKKASRRSRDGNSLGSKHASSASGSNSRPVDSAYASGGTGPSSSSQLPPSQAKAARLRSNQNIQNYLRDIPEGLWPKPVLMTESEKQKLVVKRLEHLFTGKMGTSPGNPSFVGPPEPIPEDLETEVPGPTLQPVREAAREAMIDRREASGKTSHSRDTGSGSNQQSQSRQYSNSNSNPDRPGSGDDPKEDGSGSAQSSPVDKDASPRDGSKDEEQRPTRPRDLDPDRQQFPADNMEYIRHLGIVAPESQAQFSARDVSPDAEGWVYLNLLCNLAQLHILNVTPDFIRNAVSERSTRFQLSADGAKIRWRGGDENTRFTTDSGSTSRHGRSSDETDGSNKLHQRKKQKRSKFNVRQRGSNSESFHYKPLFLHRQSSSSDDAPSGGDESGSSSGQHYSNHGWASKGGQSGDSSGVTQRRPRRQGAIIYYSGAPFCTDLSGDYGEVSMDAYDVSSSSGQALQDSAHHSVHRPSIIRSASGSSIPFKPLSEHKSLNSMSGPDGDGSPETASGVSEEPINATFPWSDQEQLASRADFEASGLGGVSPEDHFLIIVSTRRPKGTVATDDDDDDDDSSVASSDVGQTHPATRPRQLERPSHETVDSQKTTGTADSVANGLAAMSTGSPMQFQGSSHKRSRSDVKIEYVSKRVQRLSPTPLPPPAFYHASDDSDFDDGTSPDGDESWSSERSILSKRPFMEASPASENRNLSSADEEDDDWESDPELVAKQSISSRRTGKTSGINKYGDVVPLAPLAKVNSGSSGATNGNAAASGYDSSMEDE